MRSIRQVLSTVQYTGCDLARLRDIFKESAFIQVSPDDSKGIAEALKEADVAVLDADLDDRILSGKKLRWIHCNHAGLARSARPEIFERGIILTGSAGRSAPVLAEHAIFFMLNACYHARELAAAHQSHRWGVPKMENWRGLFGRTAGIVGMGNTGRALAERLHVLGMNVIVYDRYRIEDYPFADRWLDASRGDSLDVLLSRADFVILCIALTDDTWHLIDEKAFRGMKEQAVLVNIARGELVDTAALLRALDSGLISCAGLDVFEQEPLPPDDPLWDHPNVYITPHVTPQVPSRAGRCLDIIEENVRRYINEEPMLNRVGPGDVYTHDIPARKSIKKT